MQANYYHQPGTVIQAGPYVEDVSPGWSSGGAPYGVSTTTYAGGSFHATATPEMQGENTTFITLTETPGVGEGYIGAPADDPEWEERAVAARDLTGVQTMIADFTWHASPHDMARSPKLTISTLNPDTIAQTSRVTRNIARDVAGEEHREGDPARTLFLGAEIIGFKYDLPRKAGIKISHLVPKTFSRHGTFNYTLDPYTEAHGIKINIFDPVNKMSAAMLERSEFISPASVNAAIQFPSAQNPMGEGAHALFDTQSYAWQWLADKLSEGRFPDFHDHIMAAAYGTDHHERMGYHWMPVPLALAQQVYTELMAPVQDLPKLYTDMRTVQAQLVPADGQAWDSMRGLVGTGLNTQRQAMTESLIQQPGYASVKVRFHYVQEPKDANFKIIDFSKH